MRDDLHRTPALTRYWKTAVRHAERVADRDRVAYDLSRAAKQEMDARIRPEWLNGLRDACGGNHGQLFPETQVEALSTYEGTTRSPLEQRVLEITRATCLQRPGSTDVVDSSMREVHQLLVESGIEHVAAAVRQDKGVSQARQLRACLAGQQAKCSLELGQQKPPKKPKVKDLLDMEVSAS
jgi:hypothetical protein